MKKIIFGLVILLLWIPGMVSTVTAQYFGMNKIQYEEFKWKFLQSEHFDIYFYPGGYDLARFTAEEAESAYVKLRKDFRYEIMERIAIVVYKSHNHFQQTNVVTEFMDEGIGGVTELYKNRVVLPYEGSYSQFRHVIHHELVHAVMNDMLYGGSVQSLVTGSVVQVPLWFSEGLAEYAALHWDTRLDMVIRDATLTGYLPPIDFLDYMPYQGGASVFRYIAQKYGDQKITEIINKIKGSFRFQNAFQSALGIDFKDLTEQWQLEMKREYWPDIADRKEPAEIARALTDHRKDNNYLNNSPSISPQGDRMLFLSNREGKMSIYLMDVLEGKVIRKLIQGESDVNFEELHFLEPGFSWSPDGQKISLAAKAGDKDALYIYDLVQHTYKQYKYDLDGLFSTVWSPRGDEIAFIGHKDGASDVYILSLQTKKITNLTKDVFSDKDPSWSPDGQRIVFTSDRGDYPLGQYTPAEFDMHRHDYENDDVFIMNRDGSDLQRITFNRNMDGSALFTPDGKQLAYISEQNGISNIYIHNLETNESYPITNLISGAFQLSWDRQAQKLAFTTFYKGGWDIYLIKNPLQLGRENLSPTVFVRRSSVVAEDTLVTEHSVSVVDSLPEPPKADESSSVTDFSTYVFADMDRRTPSKPARVVLKEEEYRSADGEYRVNNYKIKFSPDIIYGSAGFDTYFGFSGVTQIALSDMLGDHKIYIGFNGVFDLRNSNISVTYLYLPNRIDYGLSVFHISNFFRSYYGLVRFRNYGFDFLISRPFDKFTRIDFDLSWFNIMKEYLQFPFPSETVRTIMPSVSLVTDRIEWGMTGPENGMRYSITARWSPKYTEQGLDFQTVMCDLRRYVRLAQNYSLAFRLNAGASAGEDPQRFYLGGTQNWINPYYKGAIRAERIEDIYFSEFIMPMRGAAYYEKTGTRFGLFNFEFRFPMIPFVQLGMPPIALGNIQGLFFWDVGTAWNNSFKWKGVSVSRSGVAKLDDLVSSFGLGTRIFFFGILWKIDMAWRYDGVHTSPPIYFWSMGADF
jgi:Tol biopolymer transport system component